MGALHSSHHGLLEPALLPLQCVTADGWRGLSAHITQAFPRADFPSRLYVETGWAVWSTQICIHTRFLEVFTGPTRQGQPEA